MNDQPKHSPAPWFWDDEEAMPWTDYDETIHAPFLMDANGRAIMSGDDIRIRNEADGVLIAKAGEMAGEIERLKQENAELLEVLKLSLIEHKEVRGFLNVRISEGEPVYTWLGETESMIERIKAAISKAERREA